MDNQGGGSGGSGGLDVALVIIIAVLVLAVCAVGGYFVLQRTQARSTALVISDLQRRATERRATERRQNSSGATACQTTVQVLHHLSNLGFAGASAAYMVMM